MTKTKTEIAQSALRHLGEIPIAQDSSAEAFLPAREGVENAHAELGRLGIAHWPIEETPDYVATYFALYVAGLIAHIFVDENRASYFSSRMREAERRMAAVTHTPDASGSPVRFETF